MKKTSEIVLLKNKLIMSPLSISLLLDMLNM